MGLVYVFFDKERLMSCLTKTINVLLGLYTKTKVRSVQQLILIFFSFSQGEFKIGWRLMLHPANPLGWFFWPDSGQGLFLSSLLLCLFFLFLAFIACKSHHQVHPLQASKLMAIKWIKLWVRASSISICLVSFTMLGSVFFEDFYNIDK